MKTIRSEAMTHPDAPRPPMSETVKPLPQDHIEGIRTALAAGGPFFEMLEPKYIRETLARVMANLEKAERDLAQSREWRPIESAPRDGVKFQTWDAHYGVRIGRCVNRADHDDWLSYMDAHGGSSKGGIRATHWKPLDQTPPTTRSAP